MGAFDHQWVTSQLAVGSAVTQPDHVRVLVQEGVTHVVDCRKLSLAGELWARRNVVRLHCGTTDAAGCIKSEWFYKGFEFVLGALRTRKCRVLVHCTAGVSRSPSMVYALLRVQGHSRQDAEQKIRSARPRVLRITYKLHAERAVRFWPNCIDS